MKNKRVLVVLGGTSGEREVSLDTGKACIRALKKKGYYVTTFDPKKKPLNLINKSKSDVIFNALHGKGGEDGVAQSYFEYLRIPYTHSGVISSYNAMNKISSKEIFKKNKIKSPKYFALHKSIFLKRELQINIKRQKIRFPIVVKPTNEGSSIGVRICKNFDDLLDPIDIFNYESNLFTNSKIINLTVNASQKNLKNLQTLLQENTNKINMIRESNFEEDTYNDLAKIYNENAEIVRTILSTNENLNSILVSNLPNISEIQSRLRKDEFAIFFIDNIIYENGSAILISKNEIVNYSTDSYRNISFLIKNLQSSLNNIDSYDFQSAKKLYDIFFKPIEYLVPKDSTIYFLGDHLKGINPSILVKNFNASSNISEYERLVSANWLIEEYNVVKHFQIPSSSMQKINYDKKFLGYGNSTTYKQLGLVDLNEVNGEIKELALISNGSRDDILIDKNATKDKLLEKLNVSYERIAISTHAVESFWRGLTKEPALIFNNNDDDFFLTPSEIVDLKIDTDMVILSSCSSSTEGFDDLFKSFLVAGANSVVYTNWELESKYAKEFTTTFMKELWFSSDEKHEALRSTSLGFINNYDKPQYSHPAFWGNFSIAYRNL